MNKTNNIWRYIFYALLILTALYQAAFIYQLYFTPAAFYELSDIPFDDITDFVGINNLLAMGQMYLIGMSVLAIYGTQMNNRLGVILGITLGIYFLVVGISILGSAEPFLYIFDIVRGVLTIGTGFIVLRQIDKLSAE
jgi:predicted metal-binding membrane protein